VFTEGSDMGGRRSCGDVRLGKTLGSRVTEAATALNRQLGSTSRDVRRWASTLLSVQVQAPTWQAELEQ